MGKIQKYVQEQETRELDKMKEISEKMKILKEDGSLDIDVIKKLPIDQYLDQLGQLSYPQMLECISKLQQLNEAKKPIQPIKVDYGFDDERSGVNLEEFIKNEKRKYGIK